MSRTWFHICNHKLLLECIYIPVLFMSLNIYEFSLCLSNSSQGGHKVAFLPESMCLPSCLYGIRILTFTLSSKLYISFSICDTTQKLDKKWCFFPLIQMGMFVVCFQILLTLSVNLFGERVCGSFDDPPCLYITTAVSVVIVDWVRKYQQFSYVFAIQLLMMKKKFKCVCCDQCFLEGCRSTEIIPGALRK